MTYTPENLELWTLPDYYAGNEWEGFYVFLGRNRDSDLLTESNFEVALAELGGESDTVVVVREGHWAVGWVEWIAVHRSNTKALELADEMIGALADYPVLDDSDLSEREWNAAHDAWESMSVEDRMDLCRDAGVSIYAARHDHIPSDDSGMIHDSLIGY